MIASKRGTLNDW